MTTSSTHTPSHTQVAIIGAGAAGLMAAITAARTTPQQPVTLIDGAASLGAKILVAGGGRCNVTHHTIDHRRYAPAAAQPTIRKILKALTVKQTIAFFEGQGVELKREPSGKLFPTTDKARTILDALLAAARDAGVTITHPWRVKSVSHDPQSGLFTLRREHAADTLTAQSLILATGGRSLPKTGSDGRAYDLARALGHTTTTTFPALVPLVIDPNKDTAQLTTLSGLSAVATLEVRAASGKRLAAVTASTLATHKGLSGPGPMNISRHLTAARLEDPDAALVINWLPGRSMDQIDEALLNARATAAAFIRNHPAANPPIGADGGTPLPERLAAAIARAANIDPASPAHDLKRDQRKALARAATEMTVPISGDRGWNHAEVTAGGVPLTEIDPRTMQSRTTPRLYLCGEILDVDGPIGGFNFQWAWSSGHLAGASAARETTTAT